jgi:hypothetical protein
MPPAHMRRSADKFSTLPQRNRMHDLDSLARLSPMRARFSLPVPTIVTLLMAPRATTAVMMHQMVTRSRRRRVLRSAAPNQHLQSDGPLQQRSYASGAASRAISRL